MAKSLIDAFGLVDGGLVALVGAGGKSTIAASLAGEAMTAGMRVVVTTTTKIGVDQFDGFEVVSPSVEQVSRTLGASGACLVVGDELGPKRTGPDPSWIGELHQSGACDLIIVEADGARGQRAKAPAPHEPVIPLGTSLVVAVMAADAIDRVIEDACHRPMRVAGVVGVTPYGRLTVERAAVLLSSINGGRKNVPEGADFRVALTKVNDESEADARRLALELDPIPVVLIEDLSL